jgi:hypothetical protein
VPRSGLRIAKKFKLGEAMRVLFQKLDDSRTACFAEYSLDFVNVYKRQDFQRHGTKSGFQFARVSFCFLHKMTSLTGTSRVCRTVYSVLKKVNVVWMMS